MDKSEYVTSMSVCDLTHLCHVNWQLFESLLKNQDTYPIKIQAIVIYIEYIIWSRSMQ